MTGRSAEILLPFVIPTCHSERSEESRLSAKALPYSKLLSSPDGVLRRSAPQDDRARCRNSFGASPDDKSTEARGADFLHRGPLSAFFRTSCTKPRLSPVISREKHNAPRRPLPRAARPSRRTPHRLRGFHRSLPATPGRRSLLPAERSRGPRTSTPGRYHAAP